MLGVFVATGCNDTLGLGDDTTIGQEGVLGVWDLKSANGDTVPGFVVSKYEFYADTLVDTTFVEYATLRFDTWEPEGGYAYGRVLHSQRWAWGQTLEKHDSLGVFLSYRLDLELGTFKFDFQSEPTFEDGGPYSAGTGKVSGDWLEWTLGLNESVFRKR